MTSRGFIVAGLVAATAAVAWFLVSGHDYTISAQFQYAGRLVKGGDVQVAGRKVGKITDITLTDNGLAKVTMKISDDGITPLHQGTRVGIRAVGAATLASNFVDLRPGPADRPSLSSGAVLDRAQTSDLVDLDEIFDALDPRARKNLRSLFANSAKIYAGSGAPTFNHMLSELSPAMRDLKGLTGELVVDQGAMRTLITSAAVASTTLAHRSDNLQQAVASTAQTMQAIASRRGQLDDLLVRAPGVLTGARRTLRGVDDALTALQPRLDQTPATARALTPFLKQLLPAARSARPVLAGLDAQVPPLRLGLARFRPLKTPAVNALDATGKALDGVRPTVRGIRLYASDFVLGILNGLIGISSGNYNRTGHYVHAEFTQSPFALLGGGQLSPFIPTDTPIGNLFQLRTGITNLCPGGNSAPAPDGSSPWVVDRSLCDPSESLPASVNEP